MACLLGLTAGSAFAVGSAAHASIPARVQATQELAVLGTAHAAHSAPAAGSPQVTFVPDRRPITGEQTTLPVIGHSHGCIRLATTSIDWLAARIGPGTPVKIY